MRSLESANLSAKERNALLQMKRELSALYPDIRIILYGSKARGEGDIESDLDLLILIRDPISRAIKEKVQAVKYEIELSHDIVISIIIENRDYWKSPRACAMPLHWNIDRDGVAL